MARAPDGRRRAVISFRTFVRVLVNELLVYPVRLRAGQLRRSTLVSFGLGLAWAMIKPIGFPVGRFEHDDYLADCDRSGKSWPRSSRRS